jgi:hypothetical protein
MPSTVVPDRCDNLFRSAHEVRSWRGAAHLSAALVGAVLLLVAPSREGGRGQSPANGALALTGARLIDGTGRPPIELATILIRDGRPLSDIRNTRQLDAVWIAGREVGR